MVMNRPGRALLPALLLTAAASAHEVNLSNESSMPWTLVRTHEVGTLWDDAVVDAHGRLDPLVVDRHLIAAYRLTDWRGTARATLFVVGFTVKDTCTTAFIHIKADAGFEDVVRTVYLREAHDRYRLVARSYSPRDGAPPQVCPRAPRRNRYLTRLDTNLNLPNAFRPIEFRPREEDEGTRVGSLLGSPEASDRDLVTDSPVRPEDPVVRNLSDAFGVDEHGDDEEDPPHTP